MLTAIFHGVSHTYILKHFAFDDIDHMAWLYPKIFLVLRIMYKFLILAIERCSDLLKKAFRNIVKCVILDH